jgi:hypothetical protein
MNEIPKNTPNIPQQSQKIELVRNDAVQEIAPQPAETQQAKEITEIPENPANRAGIRADNLENDIKAFVQNPELAQKALEIGELAEKKYADAGMDDASLRALAVSRAFVDEFQKA